jgi:hypothetical protein
MTTTKFMAIGFAAVFAIALIGVLYALLEKYSLKESLSDGG